MQFQTVSVAAPRRADYRALALFVLVALATRFQQFGNPIIHIDEQFYLLVGDRMLSGAIPYVDIWDRKPIGLFLIYAAARLLGGTGVLQYQLVATGFAIATAMTVRRTATRLAGPVGATLAGCLYLLWIPLLTGQGGQSPVFYNLFMALAALAVLRAAEAPARLLGWGLAAMLATGLAMQIKYSALFEGGLFGLALIVLGVRARIGPARLAAASAAWIATALAPTIAAGLAYWRIGHFADFWFANFVSIFQRGSLDTGDSKVNACTLLLYIAPLAVLAARGVNLRLRRGERGFAAGFLTAWLATATLSVVAFGYYFDHYGLPLVLPAAIGAATVLDDRAHRHWTATVLAGAAIACALLPHFNQKRRGTPAEFARLVAAVRPSAGRGLLVWDNLPALYTATHAPLPGRFPFPTHLRDSNELGAVGVGRTRELDRILATHPAVIVIERGKPHAIVRGTTVTLLLRVARDYRPIARIKVGRRDQNVYLWKGV